MADPDYIYDPDDWEYTGRWQERDDLADDCEVQDAGIKLFKTLTQGPDKFCVMVDWKYCWFNTRGEAETAWKASRSPQETTDG